jgi:hypothetical protein
MLLTPRSVPVNSAKKRRSALARVIATALKSSAAAERAAFARDELRFIYVDGFGQTKQL